MSNPIDHPLDAVWDAVIEASEDGDASGRISYDGDGPGLGWMAATVDGERYVVEIYKKGDEDGQ